MRLLVSLLAWLLRADPTSRRSRALENLALRQQPVTYTRILKWPRLKTGERAFWGALSMAWRDWRSSLVLVKPATVIAWHRCRYQPYWAWKCGNQSRPSIPAERIAFIQRISTDHPVWVEDRITDELGQELDPVRGSAQLRLGHAYHHLPLREPGPLRRLAVGQAATEAHDR